jgi:hypothetical protein
VLVFPELVIKGLPEQENRARIGEITVYVPLTLQTMKTEEITSALHQGSSRFPWIYRFDSPCNLFERILQRRPVPADFSYPGILDAEEPPDTKPDPPGFKAGTYGISDVFVMGGITEDDLMGDSASIHSYKTRI